MPPTRPPLDSHGQLELWPSETGSADRPPRAFPPTETSLAGRIDGPFASWQLEQAFASKELEDQPLRYRLSVPRRSTVDQFLVTLGSGEEARQIRAVIAPKKKAEAIFEQARRRGLTATLSHADHPDRIDFFFPAGLAAQTRFELEGFSPLRFRDQTWELPLEFAIEQGETLTLNLDLPAESDVQESEIGVSQPNAWTRHESAIDLDTDRVHLVRARKNPTASRRVIRQTIRIPRRKTAPGHLWIQPTTETTGVLCAEVIAPTLEELPKELHGQPLQVWWIQENGTVADVYDRYPTARVHYKPGLPIVLTAKYEKAPPVALVFRPDIDHAVRRPLAKPLMRPWVRWVYHSNHATALATSDPVKGTEAALKSMLLSPWTSIIFVLAR